MTPPAAPAKPPVALAQKSDPALPPVLAEDIKQIVIEGQRIETLVKRFLRFAQPTSSVKRGALAGAYAGATASATVGVGAGANVLVGGFNRSITLQPVSIEGNTGLNVAAGIGEITLHFEAPEMMMGPPPGEPPPPPPG